MYRFTDNERKVYESLSIPMAIYQYIDGNTETLLVSDGFCKMKNIDRESLAERLTSSMFEMVHPDDAGRLAEIGQAFAMNEGPYDVVYRTKSEKDPDYHMVHTVGHMKTMDDGQQIAFLYYTDLSNSAEEGGELTENYYALQVDQFYKDHVTGLPNTNYIHKFATEKMNSISAEGKLPVMVLINMCGMQTYNANYGYREGDELLKLMGTILLEIFEGALITRGHVDHFVVLTDEEHVMENIQRAHEEIRKRASQNTLGFQAGICNIVDGISGYEAIDNARRALRTIRHDLNQIYAVYSGRTDEAYWKQRYIIENFDKALENHWIQLYYQGIMRVESGKMSSLEALARWNDPVMGMISPGEFIPVLEKYRLMYKLDMYMVEELCKEVPQRQKCKLPIIPVSINFSGQDFDNPAIVDDISAIVDRYGVERRNLIIEITEQALPRDTGDLYTHVKDLRSRGFKVWLDDFGSGYSSLNLFSRYPLDLIKLDMDFLRHLDENHGANRAIVRAIVETAHLLGMQTLAEGVETEEQLNFIRLIGCDLAQGYLYHKPESLGAIEFRNKMNGPVAACETPEEAKEFLKRYEHSIYR